MADRKSESFVSGPRGRLARWTGLAVVGLGFIAVPAEALLRANPDLCPPQQQLKLAEAAALHSFVDDPDLGARPVPLLHDVVRTLDFTYAVTLDSLGFPNPMPWPTQPDVAVLGNSLIVGPGVGIGGQFTTLLGRALGGRAVLNLGLPGGSPQQQLRIYSKHGRPLRPKVAIATLWVASDIDNTVQFEHWLDEGSPPDFTAYRRRFGTTHGSFSLLGSVRDVLSESYLLRAMFHVAGGLARPEGLEERVRFPDGETVFLSVRVQRRLARGAARAGFDLQSDLVAPLQQLRAAADSDGTRFVVVLLPSKEETYGADSFPAVLTTVRDVRAGLDAANLPVLDLYDVFRERARGRSAFYKRDIHFNAFGNALVARAIEQWMASAGVTARAPRTLRADRRERRGDH